MGFFQELKEDLSLAVNELLPEDESGAESIADEINSEEISNEADQLIAEAVAEMSAQSEKEEESAAEDSSTMNEEIFRAAVERIDENADAFTPEKSFAKSFVEELEAEQTELSPAQPLEQPKTEPAAEPMVQQNMTEPSVESIVQQNVTEPSVESAASQIEEEPVADHEAEADTFVREVCAEVTSENPVESELEKEVQSVVEEKADSVMGMDVLDETAIVTKGMKVKGSISSQGALDVLGSIKGDVEILGKLNVSGCIEGNSNAAEVFADAANVTGDIHATGTVKIGLNSVIIGNIFATSAVIAGAVKGDIDVQGPVVLDSTAIIMGNIKSKSVQMNNGAVIEGMCSQCYADVSPSSFFKDIK